MYFINKSIISGNINCFISQILWSLTFISLELLWNELIYSKYSNQIKIDKNLLIKKINNLNNEIRKEYLLSEIIFMKPDNENLNDFIKKINTSISDIGFNNNANI